MRTDLPSSTLYDDAYFLSPACDGLTDYLEGGLSLIRRRELDLLDLQGGHKVLDLGCGRGEAAAEMVSRGAVVTAMDYSADAVGLTKRKIEGRGGVVRADGSQLPFRDGQFDRVLMGDVIEHLPWQMGTQSLREVHRILAPGGRALIHTSPNTWFISVVKPPLVLVLRALRRKEVLSRFAEYDRLRYAMHPNELSPIRFPRLLREAGVTAKVWVDRDVLRSGSSEWTEQLSNRRAVRLIGRAAGLWPFRLVLGNDLYSLIEKS